jgi:hypothetical protein
MLHAKTTSHDKVIRHFLAQNLQCSLDSGASGNRGAGRASQVCIIKIGQSICRRTNFPTHSTFFPSHHGVMCTQFGQHGPDCISIANHDSIHSTDFAGLRPNAEPASSTNER